MFGKITRQELSDSLNNELNKISILKTDLEEHKADNVKHITSTERDTWNNKQNVLPIENRRKITFGTANPSGGSDGDIYFQYE